MPRQARILLPGVPLHIIQRGHNRQPCFYADADFRAYLNWLRKCAALMDASIHAYVLMTNHVHLLASFAYPEVVSDFMKAIGQQHTQYLNHRLGRTGTVWEGRFKSCPVPTETYLIVCQKYIELNPVRARMVDCVDAYPWSSYRDNAGNRHDTLVRPHYLYMAMGQTADLRARYYQGLFENVETRLFDDIRRATMNNSIPGQVAKKRGRPAKNQADGASVALAL